MRDFNIRSLNQKHDLLITKVGARNPALINTRARAERLSRFDAYSAPVGHAYLDGLPSIQATFPDDAAPNGSIDEDGQSFSKRFVPELDRN